MIYIQRNTSNDIVLELSGLTSDIYFLFELIPEMTAEGSNQYITYKNFSLATNRYDLFRFVESDGGKLGFCDDTTCKILPGQYKYNVYSTNIIMTESNYLSVVAGPIISTGRLVSIGENEAVNEVYW